MSAPLIWIFFPGVAAIGLWFLNQKRQLVTLIAVGICLLLVLFAAIFPVAGAVHLGPLTLEIQSTLIILGRRFVLDNNDTALLSFLFLFGAFWFLGGWVVGPHRYFIPLGLAMLALSVAALSVEPFLYAALLIELIVFLSIPILVPPGRHAGKGVMRYLIFQSLAMPFLLFAGWASAGYEANPADPRMLTLAVVLLGLGLAFWLAVFPFYTWAPLLAEEASPYICGFIFCLLPMVVLLLALEFFNAFPWLRVYPPVSPALRLVGLLMIISGGVWAAFQQNLKRLIGYALIFENGFALLALSLSNQVGYQMIVMTFLSRVLAFGVWSLGLEFLQGQVPLNFLISRGLLHRFPFVSLGILGSIFSVAGLPLLAGFPIRLSLMENLAQQSLVAVLWVVIGIAGFWLSGFRVLSAFVQSNQVEWKMEEGWPIVLLLSVGVIMLFLFGLFPHRFLLVLQGMLQAFEQLR